MFTDLKRKMKDTVVNYNNRRHNTLREIRLTNGRVLVRQSNYIPTEEEVARNYFLRELQLKRQHQQLQAEQQQPLQHQEMQMHRQLPQQHLQQEAVQQHQWPQQQDIEGVLENFECVETFMRRYGGDIANALGPEIMCQLMNEYRYN